MQDNTYEDNSASPHKIYIDIRKLEEKIPVVYSGHDGMMSSRDVRMALRIAIANTSDDVVEVVRCKDCEFRSVSIDPATTESVKVCGCIGRSPVQSSQVADNDYCSHGKRRKSFERR